MSRNKRGLSEIVSYVLLILIAFIVGTVIFVWLRGISGPSDIETCPTDGVSITIKDAVCNDAAEQVTVTIRNTGMFNISGIVVKGLNNVGGVENLVPTGETLGRLAPDAGNNNLNILAMDLKPNQEDTFTFNYSSLGNVNEITVIAIRAQENEYLICEKAYASQPAGCN